ncbi:MAG: hypothetical protein A3K65_09120 [Euryarchaeota archaeon RBG_16_68_12]|nr:MAG: hypothetical protein A3K65_09120 [Euryarchaeota archaeon RBG_16_68_12]
MRKVLGVLTEDFRLYHDLVAALRARGVPFVTLSFSRRIPETVGAVLTSPQEAGRIRRPPAIAVGDVDAAIAKALQALEGHTYWKEIVVGIDPGEGPGVAVVGDGQVLDTRLAPSPEAVAGIVRDALRTFPASRHRVRVGHGDRTNRNRILNALDREGVAAEIVDEAGTTDRTEEPDIGAAIKIAFVPGVRATPPYDVTPTPGEVREIQRRSRVMSDGEVTISKGLAAQVARGEFTLDEAIQRQKRRS